MAKTGVTVNTPLPC